MYDYASADEPVCIECVPQILVEQWMGCSSDVLHQIASARANVSHVIARCA